LVRTNTSVKPQEGISFLLIPMTSPGVTIRPIITIDGAHEVNDVFFDGVRVPVENRVGEENKGWTYAKFLLGNERTAMAGTGRAKRNLEKLKRILNEEVDANDPAYRALLEQVSRAEVDVLALEATEYRMVSQLARGEDPGPASSLLKIRGTEIFQRITLLIHQASGVYGLAFVSRESAATNTSPARAPFGPPQSIT